MAPSGVLMIGLAGGVRLGVATVGLYLLQGALGFPPIDQPLHDLAIGLVPHAERISGTRNVARIELAAQR